MQESELSLLRFPGLQAVMWPEEGGVTLCSGTGSLQTTSRQKGRVWRETKIVFK